jgi:hypothetical protein
MGTNTRTNEQGIAHLLMIVLLVVIVAVIAGAGYEVYSHQTSSTGSNSSGSTAADASCIASYHDANLCNFASNAASFAKTAYTATLTTNAAGTTSTTTLKNDGTGNYTMNGSAGGQTINTVTLDGVNYIQSNGTWYQYPSGKTAPSSNPTSNMNITLGATGITYKNLGTMSCGSMTCYEYQVSVAATPGLTQYVWFDTGSYKLREWKYTSATGSTDMVITYGSVSIVKPSPVQPLSSVTGQ